MSATRAGSGLVRHLGLLGATVVGVAAMLGTGVFAVWTPALALSGSWLLVALGVAAACAGLNAVSAVRLAAQHPESGGAYAYARIRLGRPPAVVAGWAFILGKAASAAAAGLTIGVYLMPQHPQLIAWLAIGSCLALDLAGLRRSVVVSGILVVCVLLILIVICTASLMTSPLDVSAWPSGSVKSGGTVTGLEVLAASGLIFLAFAGYARITVLGEEVRQPAWTIPRAVTLSLSMVLLIYVAVAVTVLVADRAGLTISVASLESVVPESMQWLVAVGAVIAAGASLLALLTAIGRTTFAMARRGDAPGQLATVQGGVPRRAAVVAAVLAALVVTGGSLPWAVGLSSAFVLTYYAVMHVTACTLPGRIIMRWVVPAVGIGLCSALVLALVLMLPRVSALGQ